jgi:hypothetical protein
MKKHYYFILAFVIIAFSITSSCKKEPKPDVNKPSVELYTPANNFLFYCGGELEYHAMLKDDNQLYSYKIDITAQTSSPNSWVNHFIRMIDGTEQEVFDTIFVPKNIEVGNYTFTITCNDTSYNEKAISVTIQIAKDLTPPVVSLTQAPSSGQIYIATDTIRIAGNVTENYKLANVFVAVMNPADNIADTMATTYNSYATFLDVSSFSDPKNYSFASSLIVGNPNDNDGANNPDNITWAPGSYYILVRATDRIGNRTILSHIDITIQ